MCGVAKKGCLEIHNVTGPQNREQLLITIISDGIVTLPFPLSHVQLASMVGTTRETMTVQVRQLSRKGVLKTNKSCFEINLEKLREMTDVE